MPRTGKERRGKDEERASRARTGAFWSGTIAFGLVAVPVHLYAALRRNRPSLRMVAEDGTPVERRYYCSTEDVPVERDEIVRGFEVEDGEFVVVEDEELEALAPTKSREIDLRRFVPREEVEAARLERAYVLAPEEGAVKPYRLLAHALEVEDRFGIATFVMRDKEHLIAIGARNGLLLAQTLRFAGELRTAEEAGLAGIADAPPARVEAVSRELERLAKEKPKRGELVDRQARRLRNLVEAKLEADDDVLRTMAGWAATESDGGDTAPPDLMRRLKRSLAEAGGEGDASGGGRPRGRRVRRGRDGGRAPDERAVSRDALAERTKEELYATARELDIPGRSSMNKQELIDAIRG